MVRLIKKILRFCFYLLNDIFEYFASWISGFLHYKEFNAITTYCMFIGYARSGHSIIGTLLDAHQNVVIAHELNVLRYIKKGYNKLQIFSLLVNKSKKQSITGRRFADKNYKVPNQWQGRYSKLLVIGDKKGGGSSKILKLYPDLLRKLVNKIKLEIKIIHVIRNPYDNITTIARRRKKFNPLTWEDLKDAIDFYFYKVDSVNCVKKTNEYEILDIKHEDFIRNPGDIITKLCNYLQIIPEEKYLADCQSILYREMHKSRFDVKWPEDLIDLVSRRMKQYPFLENYSYKD